MNQNRKTYFLFVLTNKLASLRRRLFPVGTYREVFYKSCLQPLGLWTVSRLSQRPQNEASFLPPFDRDALPHPDQIQRILIIKADHIGDFVFALPAFQALRQTFANAKITLLCGTWNRDLAIASGLFNEVVCANIYQPRIQGGFSFTPDEALTQLSTLSSFDIAIDLKHEPDTRFLLGWVKARFKAGFASHLMPSDMSLVVPTFPFAKKDHGHEAHMRSLLSILAHAVIATFEAQPMTQQGMQRLAKALPATKLNASTPKIIGLNPGSGSTARNWPLLSLQDLARRLVKEGVTIALFGTKAEKTATDAIIAAVGAEHVLDYTDQLSLNAFIASVDQLDLYIGHNTGSTHIAAALTPTLCLFAGTNIAERVAPTGSKLVILRQNVPCAPCGLTDVNDCPYEHRCMTGITVDQVMAEAKRLLGQESH